MKKKLIFAIATGFFAVATVFKMNLVQGNSAGDVSLEAIAVMARAGDENSSGSERVVNYDTTCISIIEVIINGEPTICRIISRTWGTSCLGDGSIPCTPSEDYEEQRDC